jgi:hypothetical protein
LHHYVTVSYASKFHGFNVLKSHETLSIPLTSAPFLQPETAAKIGPAKQEEATAEEAATEATTITKTASRSHSSSDRTGSRTQRQTINTWSDATILSGRGTIPTARF